MRRWGLPLLLLFLLPGRAFGGSLSLEPKVIDSGGVALLRWQGENTSFALARFRDSIFFLERDPQGAVALVGADVELTPGNYTLEVWAVDRQGRSTLHHLTLRIRETKRPVERLSLPPAMVTPKDPAVLKRIAREREMLRKIFAGGEDALWWRTFSRPVADPISSPFGLRRILNGQPRDPHSGIDFRSPRGRVVRAAAKGKVVFAGALYYTGRTVILDHGGGLFSFYAHLDSVACKQGQLLKRGGKLGRVGSTGRATGPHLHWGMKLRGDRIDPLAVLALPVGERP